MKISHSFAAAPGRDAEAGQASARVQARDRQVAEKDAAKAHAADMRAERERRAERAQARDKVQAAAHAKRDEGAAGRKLDIRA